MIMKNIKKIIYLLMVAGVVSLMLGCSGASDPAAPLSLIAEIEWTGYRNTLIGITANKDISDVGVIISSSDSLTQTNDLMAEKVYYKRNLTADKKILVHLGLLNGFTLKDYTPDPSVIKTGVNPATLSIPQPGKTYYVYVFYPEHNQRLEVTTEALHTGSSAGELGQSLHRLIGHLGKPSYRAGELHIFPTVMQGADFIRIDWILGSNHSEKVFGQQNGDPIRPVSGTSGNIIYEYNTTSENFKESAVLKLMEGTEKVFICSITDSTSVVSSYSDLELNQ